MAKSLKLLLTENVDSLGIVGDVVTVRTGYARNYLLPRNMATTPSEERVKELAGKRAEAEKQVAMQRKAREELNEKLKGVEVTLIRSCNDMGILYGAITQQDVAAALGELGHAVKPRDVRIAQTIKRIDSYDVHVKLDSDLDSIVKLNVKPDRELDTERETEAAGAAEALFAFEFPCPPGYRPIALYVKGSRHTVDDGTPMKVAATFRSSFERDAVVTSGFTAMSGGGAAVTSLDTSAAVKAVYPKVEGNNTPSPVDVNVSEYLNITIQLGTQDQMEINEDGYKNIIINGEVTLPKETVDGNRGMEKNIQVRRLLVAEDQNIVQIEAGDGHLYSVMNRIFTNQTENAPPTLFDQNNQPYVPVGYVYKDETKYTIRYTPGNPLTKLDDLPKMSLSRPEQRLTLIYRVSKGVQLKHYGAGPKITVTFDPPYLLDKVQGRS